ncbi:hypothetical protein ASG14_12945 [Pedobacter sp. Leaf194]|nr:hypothetical protein ASG14_12945 [Pedobacter sp. Leaf194]
MTVLSEEKLAKWVAQKHNGQLIKQTGLPYFSHLLNVANTSKIFSAFGFEIGLCHDLLEDTQTTFRELIDALKKSGYDDAVANHIGKCVTELTDVYGKRDFPAFSKKERKKREARRLLTISPDAQTVKYADLIDNIAWMLAFDKKNVKKYLKRKQILVLNLDQGNPQLRAKALKLIVNSLKNLKA